MVLDVRRLETREQTGSSVLREHVNMPLSARQRPYGSWCLKEWEEAEEQIQEDTNGQGNVKFLFLSKEIHKRLKNERKRMK